MKERSELELFLPVYEGYECTKTISMSVEAARTFLLFIFLDMSECVSAFLLLQTMYGSYECILTTPTSVGRF